ncbi:MAG: hypothetical protein GF368_04020 [Candidatus Aenigmarchaeota archaeon]|nr:hypothetical protein [Candidatus Aenigmarchaeota archaeon]
MPDVFTIVIKKLEELGAFNFLFPFMLTTAIFYGLLRRSKIFMVRKKEYVVVNRDTGEKKEYDVEVGGAVNAVVAVIAGFMVWAYPILAGVNIQQQLSVFFMQGAIVTLIFIIGLMILGMFLKPGVADQLHELIFKDGKFGVTAIIIICIGVGVLVFVTSGLLDLIVGPVFTKIDLGNDMILTIVVLGLLILPLIFILRDAKPMVKEPKEGNGD